MYIMECWFCSKNSDKLCQCTKCNEWVCEKCIWPVSSGDRCTRCINMSDGLYRHIFNELFFKGIDMNSLSGQSKIIKISHNNIAMPKKAKQPETPANSVANTPEPTLVLTSEIPKDDAINQIKVLRTELKAKRKELKALTDQLRDIEGKLYN